MKANAHINMQIANPNKEPGVQAVLLQRSDTQEHNRQIRTIEEKGQSEIHQYRTLQTNTPNSSASQGKFNKMLRNTKQRR